MPALMEPHILTLTNNDNGTITIDCTCDSYGPVNVNLEFLEPIIERHKLLHGDVTVRNA